MSDRSLVIKVSRNRGDGLQSFQPNANTKRRLVISGEWSQSPFHQGFVEYYLAPTDEEGTWVLEAVHLDCDEPDDDVALPEECTDRDVDEIAPRAGPNAAGLAFPVDSAYVVAVAFGVPLDFNPSSLAEAMYEAAIRAGAAQVDHRR